MDTQEKYLTTKTNPIQHQIAGALGAGAIAVIGLFIGFAGFWGGALMIIGIALLSAALAVWIASKNVWKSPSISCASWSIVLKPQGCGLLRLWGRPIPRWTPFML